MRQQVCWKTVARSIERQRMLLILSAFLWIWSVLQLLSPLIQRFGHHPPVLLCPLPTPCPSAFFDSHPALRTPLRSTCCPYLERLRAALWHRRGSPRSRSAHPLHKPRSS